MAGHEGDAVPRQARKPPVELLLEARRIFGQTEARFDGRAVKVHGTPRLERCQNPVHEGIPRLEIDEADELRHVDPFDAELPRMGAPRERP